MTTMKDIVDKETLIGLVGRRITCPVTNKVMDYRQAVAFEFTRPGRPTATLVMSAEAWDKNRDLFEARGTVAEVIDGRTLQ